MTKRMGRVVAAGVSVAFLLGGSLSSAYGSEPGPASDPKGAGASHRSLPLDITGDAVLSQKRDRLRDVLRPLQAYDGGMIWDPAGKVLTIQMTSDAAITKARGRVAASKTTLQTKFVRVQYSAKELDDLSNRLLGNQLQWAGATGIGGGHDVRSNRVVLEVDREYKDAATLISAIEKLKDPRVSLQVLDAIEGWRPESRVDDWAPWSAGAAIDGNTGYRCTLGWTWRLWGTGEVVSSTARHCTDLFWYNNGTYLGTVYQSSQWPDSALIRGTSYSPTVFVGNQTTSDFRTVKTIDTSWQIGDSVAMSGRTTGLNVTTVQDPNYTLPSCAGQYAGMVGVLMQSHVTDEGDSGGPWLTTQSDGTAVAHGQHFGRGCLAGKTGSFFVKLNTISAAQRASILLG